MTGVRYTRKDLDTLADRAATQIRLFNNREGMGREDDTLPPRVFEEPLPDGPPAGKCIPRAGFEKMLTEYYRLRGWDDEGVPLTRTIKALKL